MEQLYYSLRSAKMQVSDDASDDAFRGRINSIRQVFEGRFARFCRLIANKTFSALNKKGKDNKAKCAFSLLKMAQQRKKARKTPV